MDTSATAIYARIEECRAAAGKTWGEVDGHCGGSHVRKNIARGSAPGIDKLVLLAEALETSPAFLAFGLETGDIPEAIVRAPNLPTIASVPYIGEVAAGLWLEVDQAVDVSPREGLFIPPDPAYPVDQQFAVGVRGTSINKVAPDGAVLGCIDTRKSRMQPRQGELVVVEQSRAGGQEIMRTAKRYRAVAGGFELWPESDDPEWSEPIRIRPDPAAESTTIQVIGIVTWVHRPL